MSKSNDNIPADEMLLAEAIAAAANRELRWCRGARFKDAAGNWTTSAANASRCCALGALELAGRVPPLGVAHIGGSLDTICAADGNDRDHDWMAGARDDGESLGWAFRCAMEDA